LRCLYFKIFSASFLITFLSPEIATSINMHVLFSLSRIIIIIITYLLTYLLTYLPTYLYTTIEFSLGGSSSYTSTDKTNKNNYT
jgi:hypothetical protein